MVRHSMKMLALSLSLSLLSKKHWSKKFFVLFEAKAVQVFLRIKRGGKKFCNLCALFKDTFIFVLKLLIIAQPEFTLLAQPSLCQTCCCAWRALPSSVWG